jgi:arylsulfatase A-like enzyme
VTDLRKMSSRPNFIVVLADDMGFSDLGCYGGEVRTPNIDALAAGGLRYTQAYNAARCCPSRAALLTGVHPHQAGIGWMTFGGLGTSSSLSSWTSMIEQRGPYQGFLSDSCATIADVLRSAGYRTLLSGKWHLGGDVRPEDLHLFHPSRPGPPVTPLERGFDKFWGLFGGAAHYFSPRILMNDDRILEIPGDGFYLTDAITDHAIEMIDSAPEGCPFFLYLAYTAPHWPLHALEEDVAHYERTYARGWDTIRAERHDRLRDAGLIESGWRISKRDPDSFAFTDAKFPDWEARRMAVYAAQIDRMDQGVGRVAQYLRERKLLDDTVVMVCSDNGGSAEFLQEEASPEGANRYEGTTVGGLPMRVGNIPEISPGGPTTFMSYDLPWSNASNSPFRRFKSWVHEGGISTPLVVHWPSGIRQAGTRHAPVHFIDVLPTIAELAGAPIPTERSGAPLQPVEGESFAASFDRTDWRRNQPLWFEHEGNRALRSESWKLVLRHPGRWELYNMENDRTETFDLADREAARVRRMTDSWESTANRVGVRPNLDTVWDGVSNWHVGSALARRTLYARP